MLFNSFSFMVFFPIVFFIYWILPQRFKWVLLLVASYYFYMSWNAKYVVLIVFTTVISYFAAILLERTQSIQKKKVILVFSLIAGSTFLFQVL